MDVQDEGRGKRWMGKSLGKSGYRRGRLSSKGSMCVGGGRGGSGGPPSVIMKRKHTDSFCKLM